MGQKKLVEKTISGQQFIHAMQATGLSLALGQQMYNGVWLLGDYQGYTCIVDLDLLVKQPLVHAEQLHIMGILDGRLAAHDLVTVTIPLGALANAQVTGTLTVPTGEVWFINAVRMFTPADAGGSPTVNWHCSIWTDPAVTPSAFGQPFHAAGINFTPGGGTQWDEFGIPATIWDAANKPMMLRLPGGTVITFTVVNTGAVATAAMACTLALFGSIGKPLVD